MRIGKPIVLKWFAAAVVIVITIAGAFYVTAHGPQVTHQISLATTQQPERLTELYFADPTQLPSSVTVGQKLPVSFVLHNLETQAVTYTYRISLITPEGTMTVKETPVILQDGTLQTITQDVLVPAGKGRIQLSIQLLNKSQAIHAWLERK